VRITARGIRGRATMQLRLATRGCWTGLAPMDARRASEEGG
jgi:hypothetical protein